MWLPLSWPSSSLLVALERGTLSCHLCILNTLSGYRRNVLDVLKSLSAGWAIHRSMSDSEAASMRVESSLYIFGF